MREASRSHSALTRYTGFRHATKSTATNQPAPALARRLGLFDATMIVMGGIIGSGIFMNPAVVARQVTTPFLILFVWALAVNWLI